MSTAESIPVPSIRAMHESDLGAVMEIERASFSTPWSRRSFRNLMARDDADLWVAVLDERIVGYVVVWYALREAELGNIAVAPSRRRRGLGRRLLEWALERARERGSDRIFLEVRVSNREAQRLYQRRGFAQIGIRRHYYRRPLEDARVLCRELRPGGIDSAGERNEQPSR